MDDPDSALFQQTTAWRTQTQEAMEASSLGTRDYLELVRKGILLRRRWDQHDAGAPGRLGLLELLPAVQTVAYHQLGESVSDSEQVDPELTELVVRQLDEDDQYLVALLNAYAQSPRQAAFAVVCFRDDLHWLGTQVAILDGNRGVDFLGRVLLEEERLERELEACEDTDSTPFAEDALSALQPDAGSVGSSIAQLQSAARRLRATAVARQTESLLAQTDSKDCQGWYRVWQSASRLAMRLAPESWEGGSSEQEAADAAEATRATLRQSVEEYRTRALGQWNECLSELARGQRDAALRETFEELSDSATETLTFLEDLSLPDAVRSLEVVDSDVKACQKAVRKYGSRELRPVRRDLRRRRAAIAGELQERRLAWRMECLFGRWFVAALERLILILLLVFIVVLVAETRFPRYENLFAWIDLGICAVFMTEFGLKMALTRRRWLYFRRNWITGFLPSIPFGFIGHSVSQLALASEAEAFVFLRFLRYLRLPRMARWLRIARPALRVARVVFFMLRASDRLVRQLTPLLNRNLLLFERVAVTSPQPAYRVKLSALRERFYYRAAETTRWLPQSDRRELTKMRIDDLTAMLRAPQVSTPSTIQPAGGSIGREIRVESIIARLLYATPAGISDRVGRSLANSVTRWCRALDVFGVRRLPIIRQLAKASRLPSPYETTAQVANSIGFALHHLLDRVYWMADLYGTLTPPQLVDSIGEYLIKSTQRPAVRLLMFGAGFLAVAHLTMLLDLPALNQLSETLDSVVGWPLVTVGCLCLVPLLLGLWFRQIAGEATEFYSQIAAAQFITATKGLKQKLAHSQRKMLDRRVIEPELKLAGEVESSSGESVASVDGAVQRLWEEYLDSPPFHHSDTVITSQLLGNLTLISLRESRLRYGRKQKRRLRRIDLANSHFSLQGPYLWFHFISRSLGQFTAKLVEDYNTFALPLSRAETASDSDVRRYVAWLEKRLRKSSDQIELPRQFRDRLDATSAEGDSKHNSPGRSYHGNDFTTIHFLSDDEQVEADVRRRYGDQVADLIRRDRRDNFRRVFRTYPFHRCPKERRVVNPFSLYQRHLAGGRILLLPLKAIGWSAIVGFRLVRLVWSVVSEVLHPGVEELSSLDDSDPFEVAERKIHRMRKPLFLECLRMRAEYDPEYLGIVPPGVSGDVHEASQVQVEDDLALIGAEPSVKSEFRRLASERRRQMLEFGGHLKRFETEGLSSQSLRAMAIAYTIDYGGVRSCLEAAAQVERAFAEAIAQQSLPVASQKLPPWSISSFCRGLRNWRRLNRLFRQGSFRDYDRGQRAACRRWIRRQGGPVLPALRRLTGRRAGSDPLGDAGQLLLDVARDPDTWSRQLVVLRAVQTLSVLDLETYCTLVGQLGQYGT